MEGHTEHKDDIPLGLQVPTLVFAFFICFAFGGLLSALLVGDMSETGNARLMAGISNFTLFLLPGLIFSVFLYRKSWLHSVDAHRNTSPLSYLFTFAATLGALPLVHLLYFINKKIPLPDYLTNMDEGSNALLSKLLSTESTWEIIPLLGLLALLPALGEEWIFRGIIQKRLGGIIQNPHIPVWITGFLFSLLHFQFQGFFPRFFLGLFLGYLFLWSKSLWLPIFAHFVNNGVQVFIFVLGNEETSPEIDEPILTQPWWLISGALVFSTALYFLKQLTVKNNETKNVT